MATKDLLPQEAFWVADSFDFIKAEEFEALGIEPSDIPAGTIAAHKHPSQIPSRFGGNAYGFGFFEVYDRLRPKEIDLIQSIDFQDPTQIRKHYREINRIYRSIGLLKRFSRQGKPYYLIPLHLVSSSLSNIKSKTDEISKIIRFHRTKYLKESHKIGILTHADDLIVNDLSLRFKEHQFIVFDSFEKLRSTRTSLDLVILPKDIYQVLFMEKYIPRYEGTLTKRRLEDYAYYMLGKIYGLLKPDGEIFIVANRFTLKTNQVVEVAFRTEQEMKNFLLFTHLFKTKKKYQAGEGPLQVNVYDFQSFLNPPYVEKEIWDKLLGGRSPEEISFQEINDLPYLNLHLEDDFAYDQDKTWAKVLSNYFDKIFLKPLLPDSIREEWSRRFTVTGYTPGYMLIYLGQKKPLATTLSKLTQEVRESQLSGCPLALLSDYRDTFDYAVRTLTVLKRIRSGDHSSLPGLFFERLKEPLENKKKRYPALNDVLRLMSKVNRLQRIKGYLNPDNIEGPRTPLLKHLEVLSLFGFTPGELRELFLIVVGHTPMGRILSGKMNERTLKAVSDLARSQPPLQALNLLRFCRLMSMAETAASKQSDLNQEELAELFDLYESMVKVVTNREMDWDRLLDEQMSAGGGIRSKVIRKLLKMMNLFQFLDTWSELRSKGRMEKEALADYDVEKLKQIESVIDLLAIIDRFEELYYQEDPLRFSIFYRKLLNLEFHGTVHLFEKINSRLVFLLLWITANVVRSEIVNFNNVLGNVEPEEIGHYLRRVEEETHAVKVKYLDFPTLQRLSDQLYENHTAFIVGTGFQLKVNQKTQALDVDYIDLDENIDELDRLINRSLGRKISEIPTEDLKQMERLFARLESFYQSHLRLVAQEDEGFRLPERQRKWAEDAGKLREALKEHFTGVIFQPDHIYSDLILLFRHAPSILHFVLPEFMALRDIRLPVKGYLKSSLIGHILGSTRRLQALIRKDRGSFQDTESLHKLAQREFGPLAAGIVGLNEFQIETLEKIVSRIREIPPLFDALLKSFLFRDIGLIPELREKYQDQIHPADHAQAGALFLEREKIPQRYGMGKEAADYLIYLVKNHDLLHHMIRGEYSLFAIQDALDWGDKDVFDAFFVSSFTMFSSMREDLILEDLARRIFQYRTLCHRILEGKTTPEAHLREIYAAKGHIYCALEAYRRDGLPDGVSPAHYFESFEWRKEDEEQYVESGKMIYALERILRLRGIRHVEFPEMADLLVKVPLKYIYKKRSYYGIGYASFEKELFEALRIYNSFRVLPEDARHYILHRLVRDEVRIYGFEHVSTYLNYANIIKLLFLAILGARSFEQGEGRPVCLNFLALGDQIEKRYEAVNDALNKISAEQLWKSDTYLNQFFKARTGMLLRLDKSRKVLSVDFSDKVNISKKIAYMRTVTDLDQLKNYYHYSLRSLRKVPFHTEDYEQQLEKAFEERMKEITDLMIDQVKIKMSFIEDFEEITGLYNDLMDRALEIGFSDEQRHRLNDLFELRKDHLRREKLEEIEEILNRITDEQELLDYWESIKWYLQKNRLYSGKEFENLVARRFDETMTRIKCGGCGG
ncbi:MAG: hypothetical protein JRF57_03120 [Deltaproteobacteria bacterium]|nr:hypothetical protein [Deltaproteobacteria bacterium]